MLGCYHDVTGCKVLPDNQESPVMTHYALTSLASMLAALMLTACGGGADSPPTQAVASAPVPPDSAPATCKRVVTVALLGDSTMYGYDSGTQALAVHNPGVRLQEDMDTEFGAGVVGVTDYGVSGTQAMQAPRVNADVVVANYGINDMDNHEPLEQYAQEMRATGATLIETQLPVWASWSVGLDQWSYVNAARGLGLPVADAYEYVLQMPGWQALEVDGTHPVDALYVEIVDNVLAPAVAAQVKAVLARGC